MDPSALVSSPWVVLSMLPWVVLFGWLARRLLGARRVGVRAAVVTSVAGYAAGLLFAQVLTGGPQAPGFLLAGTVFALGFIMVATVGLELAAARPARGGLPMPSALPSLPHPWRSVRASARNTVRLAEISRILVRHGLGGVLGLRRNGGSGQNPPPGWPRRLRLALEQAGGMFVKLGQLLSTRVDLVPLSAARELSHLQERAAPVAGDAVRRAVERELGCEVGEVFAEFDWTPLAAASLGQVHAARLMTGEAVAVKVQRPGIADVVERDLAIVRALARTAEARAEWARTYGVVGIAEEFASRLRDELDYRVEAQNAVAVAAAVAHLPAVHVHRVWEELTTSRLLVLERLDGVSVGSAAATDTDAASRRELADTLVRAELEPMLRGQPFHADPHPGNVFLLRDGRLGLLDFGATGRLDAFERRSVIDMLSALQSDDPTLLREAVLDVADVSGGLDVDRLDRQLARFMSRHLTGPGTPDAEALSGLLTVLGSHGVSLPASTTTMFRALVTLEGTLNALVPRYQVVEEARRVAAGLVADRVRPEAVKDAAAAELARLVPLLQRAPVHLDRLATLTERGELRTQVSLLGDPRDVRLITALVNRAVLAVLGGILGVVSALLLAVDGGPALTPGLGMLEVLGYAGLSAGAVLVLRVALAAVRDEA